MWWILGIIGYLFIGVFCIIGVVAKEYHKSLSAAIIVIMNDDIDESYWMIVFWPFVFLGVLFWVVCRSLFWIARLMIFGVTTLIDSLKESSKKEASKLKSSNSKGKD